MNLITLFQLICIVLFVICLCRFILPLHDRHMVLIWCNMYTFYLYIPAWFILIFTVIYYPHDTNVILMSIFICLCHFIWIYPELIDRLFGVNMSVSNGIIIFSANLYFINPTPNEICHEIKSINPQIITVQEYSKKWDIAFKQNGIFNSYPYYIKKVRNDQFGIGIFSKYPLLNESTFYINKIPFISALIEINKQKKQFIDLYNIHPYPPLTLQLTRVYNNQMKRIYDRIVKNELISSKSNINGFIILGDFNTNQHNYWYKKFNSHKNLSNCHELCYRRHSNTFPNGVHNLPPTRIDHVFINKKLKCNGINEGTGKGSDHAPLIISVDFI